LTAATSLADVVLVDATANGPDVGRAIGLNNARVCVRLLRVAAPACANEAFTAGPEPGRLRGNGTCAAVFFAAGFFAAGSSAGRSVGFF
jgi:hypothetical protein